MIVKVQFATKNEAAGWSCEIEVLCVGPAKSEVEVPAKRQTR
jgi:hypothetical protein